MPRVSVLVNNHNYGRYLAEALQSVLGQDFPMDDVEIIAVDDGSTDDSRQVLVGFAPRVRTVLLPENRGQAAAFNAGFEAARGEILCLLDSDDWWERTKLRRVLARFDAEKDLGIVQHWCEEVDMDGTPLPVDYPRLPARYGADDFLRGDCVFTGTTGLSFRAATLRKILPVPEGLRICADGHLYNSILDAPAGNIPEVLAWRRVHATNRYAGRFRDPIRLGEHRRALTCLDQDLARLLSTRGLRLSEEFRRRRYREGLLDDLFLARYALDWGRVAHLWTESVRQYRDDRMLFKAAALLLAAVAPGLYLDLQDVYARLRNGRAARLLRPGRRKKARNCSTM